MLVIGKEMYLKSIMNNDNDCPPHPVVMKNNESHWSGLKG